jgi:hypothetical protein
MIDLFGGFLQRNLIVFLAVVLLPLKWLVVRVSQDPEAEANAVLSVPEDLCYVALGLVLGDMINSHGAFHHYFSRSQHVSIDIMITVGLNLAIALLIHRLAQWGGGHFRNWRSAGMARNADLTSRQIELPLRTADDNIRTLMVRHLVLFAISYLGQLTLVLIWLHWVGKVIASA